MSFRKVFTESFFLIEMKKRIIFGLLVLISLGVFVNASMTILEEYTTGNKYTVEIHVKKGWNLIAGVYHANTLDENSEIKRDDIKAIWYYSPLKKEYLNIHPNLNDEEFEEDISYFGSDDAIMTSAMWVYSEKSGSLKYSTIRYDKLDERKLVKGWNFVTITPDMDRYEFQELTENCNVLSSYVWWSERQSWESIYPETEFEDSEVSIWGKGMIVKVSDDCTLGLHGENDPPELPGDECVDTDDGLNYYTKGNVIGRLKNEKIDFCGNTDSRFEACRGSSHCLTEYYCNDNDYAVGRIYECPNGCFNGACIEVADE